MPDPGMLERAEEARLRQQVERRMDPHLRRRLDAEDVVQEACLELVRRWRRKDGSMPRSAADWLHYLAGQKLLQAHRRHLETQKRDAHREADDGDDVLSRAGPARLPREVRSADPTPLQVAARAEECRRAQAVLQRLAAGDRQILELRYFRHWTNRQAARMLHVSESTVSRRHRRALQGCRRALAGSRAEGVSSRVGSGPCT